MTPQRGVSIEEFFIWKTNAGRLARAQERAAHLELLFRLSERVTEGCEASPGKPSAAGSPRESREKVMDGVAAGHRRCGRTGHGRAGGHVAGAGENVGGRSAESSAETQTFIGSEISFHRGGGFGLI